MHRSLLASRKLTNALSHPSQSYFLPYLPLTPKKRKFHYEENCSPHISPTTTAIQAKQRLQTQVRGSSPTYIKLTRPYYHFPQSYSQVHYPQTQKKRKLHVRGKFTTYLTNHQSYPGQTKVTNTSEGGSL